MIPPPVILLASRCTGCASDHNSCLSRRGDGYQCIKPQCAHRAESSCQHPVLPQRGGLYALLLLPNITTRILASLVQESLLQSAGSA